MSPRTALRPAPQNGHDVTILDLPDRLDALETEVTDMRAEMRVGFASIGDAIKGLKSEDVRQRAGLWAIAKTVASKSSLLVFGSAVGSAAVQVLYRLITGHQ